MRIYVQWATAQPGDWQAVEVRNAAAVRSLPRRAVPTVASRVDHQPGWVNAINCQGIIFEGYDHIAVEYLASTDTMVITGWQDDPDDFGEDERWATQWKLSPPAYDPVINDLNSVQQRTIWATEAVQQGYFAGVEDIRPWEEFVPPPSALTFHGIWLDDAVWHQHRTQRQFHGWDEWRRG